MFILTTILAFISTNIDDIFVLMLFYAQVNEKLRKRDIVIGQYIGIFILIAVSLLGAFGVSFIPQKYTGLLGIIPIILGIKEWIEYKNDKHLQSSDDENSTLKIPAEREPAVFGIIKPEILGVILVILANGADNIGIYIPLFSGYTGNQIFLTVIIFAVMTGLLCWISDKIVSFPKIKSGIQKYKHIIVPAVFIGIGIFIIADGFFY